MIVVGIQVYIPNCAIYNYWLSYILVENILCCYIRINMEVSIYFRESSYSLLHPIRSPKDLSSQKCRHLCVPWDCHKFSELDQPCSSLPAGHHLYGSFLSTSAESWNRVSFWQWHSSKASQPLRIWNKYLSSHLI